MTEYYVYQLVDSRNGKAIYVGKGSYKRMYRHVKLAKCGSHPNKKLQNKILSILKSGGRIEYKKTFTATNESKAYQQEEKLIAEIGLTNLYNLTPGGLGAKSESVKKLWRDNEYHNKVINAINEAQAKPEYQEQRSKRFKKMWKTGVLTNSNGFAGKTHSEETKKKISNAAKNRATNSMLGKHHSEETKKKISKSLKGHVVPKI